MKGQGNQNEKERLGEVLHSRPGEGALEAKSEASLQERTPGWWQSAPLRPAPTCQPATGLSQGGNSRGILFWNDHSGFWAETGPACVSLGVGPQRRVRALLRLRDQAEPWLLQKEHGDTPAERDS